MIFFYFSTINKYFYIWKIKLRKIIWKIVHFLYFFRYFTSLYESVQLSVLFFIWTVSLSCYLYQYWWKIIYIDDIQVQIDFKINTTQIRFKYASKYGISNYVQLQKSLSLSIISNDSFGNLIDKYEMKKSQENEIPPK